MNLARKRLSLFLSFFLVISLVSVPKISLADTKSGVVITQNVPVSVSGENDDTLQNNLVLIIKDPSKFDEVMKALPEDAVVSSFENNQSISVNMSSMDELQKIIKEQGITDSVSDVFEDHDAYMHKVPYDEYYASHQWNLRKINMESAWDYPTTDNEIIVAVVDTGVTPHYDMNNVINGADLSSGAIYEDLYPGQYSYDGGFHGTAVASGIASEHNYYGIAGINPKVSIMGVKVFKDGEETTPSNIIAAGITWAADHGADIINLSVGSNYGNTALSNAVSYAASKGILLVASSGNDGYQNMISYPAAYPNVLAVGSTNSYDNVSSFSNEGAQLDIVAPGESIPLPRISNGEGYYSLFSGTSFSAPTVAGAASILLSAYPDLTSSEMENILIMSARDINASGWDSASGHGIVDVHSALLMAEYQDIYDENDSTSTAQKIYPNVYYEGYIAPSGDHDYYKFDLFEPYDLEIVAAGSSELDIRIILYDANDNQLVYMDNNFTGQGEVIKTYLQAGTYFIRVDEFFGAVSKSPYSIQVNLKDYVNPSVLVFDENYNLIADKGLSRGTSYIHVSDTSQVEFDVKRDGESVGMVGEVSAEGNYEVTAIDAQGNTTNRSFVLDYDGYLRVSFDGGTDIAIEDQYVYYNSPLELPEVIREDYLLKGWYEDPLRITKWNELNPVMKNMTLFSEWEAKQLAQIEIGRIPDKTMYYEDDVIDLEGLEIIGRYSDGSTTNIDLNKISISGFDSSSPIVGQQIKLTYGTLSTYYLISVVPKILSSLEITSYPINDNYIVGQELDLSGFVLTGIYNNGTRDVLEVDEGMISDFDSSRVMDNLKVTVTVEGISVFFNVNILPKALTRIEVKKIPTDLIYVVGQDIDLSGLEVIGHYNDGSETGISLSEITVVGFDSSAVVTEQVVTVSYGGFTDTFAVEIIERELSVIMLSKVPTDREYVVGKSLDLTGIEVTGVYNDQSQEIIIITMINISGFNSSAPEVNQIVTVTVEGKKAAFVVTIIEKALVSIEILKTPDKLQYVVGQEFDITGLEVRGYYNDDTDTSMEVEQINIGGFDSSRAQKNQIITLTIEDQIAQFTVEIKERALILVELQSFPTKVIYDTGESIDLSGLVLRGTFNDGTVEEIPYDQVEVIGFESDAVSELQVALKVKEWTFSYKVNFIEKASLDVLAGNNRYSTASAISAASYSSSDTAILVQADNFPDALSAGPLAYAMNAPILLTGTDRLSGTTKTELERLGVQKVIIMGGETAISSNVEDMLKNTYGYEVERVAGSNRYNTAVLAGEYLNRVGIISETVVLASGNEFADALAAGSYAAKEGLPILLTSGTRISQNTMDYLINYDIRKIIIVGGTTVVSSGLEAVLAGMDIETQRLSGSNRSNTSAEIGWAVFPDSTIAIVANGYEFADALAAAPYAAKINAPILLVNQNRINTGIENYLKDSKIRKIIVVGGEQAVGTAVREKLLEIISN